MLRKVLPGLLLTMSVVACGQDVETAEDRSDAVIGGAEATGVELDAIGTLWQEREGSPSFFFCTGTLIAPSVVLTARHCTWGPSDRISFAFGANANAPRKFVKVVAGIDSPVEVPGISGVANDVKLALLAEPVLDVKPIAIAAAPLTAADIGKAFLGVGHGVTAQSEETGPAGLRKAANLALKGVRGSPLHALFPKFEAYASAVREQLTRSGQLPPGGSLDAATVASLRAYYDRPLAETYEVWTYGDDGQLCKGDSGGPLLGVADGERAVFGVTSAAVHSGLACAFGSVHATFGARTRAFVDDAVACRGQFTRGVCRNDGAIVFCREGRVSVERCAAGTACRIDGDTARCG